MTTRWSPFCPKELLRLLTWGESAVFIYKISMEPLFCAELCLPEVPWLQLMEGQSVSLSHYRVLGFDLTRKLSFQDGH